MHSLSTDFHRPWNDCSSDTAICNMKPIVGSRRLDNLQDYLVRKKPHGSLLRIQTIQRQTIMSRNKAMHPTQDNVLQQNDTLN